jgi:alanine racemase
MLSVLSVCIIRKKLYVTINNTQVRVIGQVGMLHTVVDVTNAIAPGRYATFEINPLLAGNIKRTYK